MDKPHDADRVRREKARGRRKWDTPTLTRFPAGEAEIGFTPSVADGGFTTS